MAKNKGRRLSIPFPENLKEFSSNKTIAKDSLVSSTTAGNQSMFCYRVKQHNRYATYSGPSNIAISSIDMLSKFPSKVVTQGSTNSLQDLRYEN
jgi:hypothetical protein